MMPCTTGISSSDEAQHFEQLLCQACRFLTVAQIESLKNPGSGICDGLKWYSNHLWLDNIHYNEDDEEKLARDIRELKRIGFEIKDRENGTELIRIQE